MIRIFLGNVGSGKTISAIRELVDGINNPYALPTYSNIVTKSKGKYGIPKNIMLTRDMLIKKTLLKTSKEGVETFKSKFNSEYWLQARDKHKGFNIVLDEAHTLMDARNSMSRQNKVMNDFLALIRKVCSNPKVDSTLTLISQLDSRLDINARKMCTEVRYHICLYNKKCSKCGCYWVEHSELSDFRKHSKCPNCGSYKIVKYKYRLLVHFFDNMRDYENWKYCGSVKPKQTVKISNIDKYFPFYDTFQLSDLISEDD
jgi:predicted Zn-ribbon and HTH transcriptional regulator